MTTAPTIPLARPGPVSDRQLDALIRVTEQIEHGTASEEGIVWFMSAAAPCLHELRRRRLAAAQATQVLTAENVTPLTRSGR